MLPSIASYYCPLSNFSHGGVLISHIVSQCNPTPTRTLYNRWSKLFDKRPHRRRTWMVQSYSPGCANVTPCNTSFIGPSESITQTVSRSAQPFLHSSRQSVVGYAPVYVLSPKNCYSTSLYCILERLQLACIDIENVPFYRAIL